jgi:hypothetical protein
MANNLKRFIIEERIPTKEELECLWKNLKLEKINNWTKSTHILMDKINHQYSNGGIKMNKYKIVENNPLNHYLMKDRNFVQNIYKKEFILNDRTYLELNGEIPRITIKDYFTDIYTLAGDLARIIGYGGAYKNEIEQKESWKIAAEFVEDEFENRFEEYCYYSILIENAKWFYDVAWDYSFIIIDIKNNEIIFIDITDTD